MAEGSLYGSYYAAFGSSELMSCKDCNVCCEKTWGCLSKSDYVQKVLILEPLSFDQFAFYCSNHRDASPYGEGSDLGKNHEYFPE